MKRILFVMLLALISVIGMAQPQGFSYQTIVRDNSGNTITNTQVKFRFTISQDGSSVYVETDTVTTNDFGLVNLVIGQGQVESGDFSAIDWSGSICSLQVDLDLQDGDGYHNMGTSAFTSVPYAQYAGSTASGVAGHEGELQFNKNNSLGSNALLNWNDTLGALGIGTHADTGRLVIQAASDAIDSLPLFQVKDKNGQTVFAVYNNSVHVFVNKEAKKRSYGAYKGGFVISGKNSGAQKANDIMVVNADSTRVFTQDEKAGFGVVGVSAKRGTTSPYMHINPDNYFIGTNSGENITTGKYNSTFGYETGKALTDGSNNNFIGYQAGYYNDGGSQNNFIGVMAGYKNKSGNYNNFLGVEAGKENESGNYNNFIGHQSGTSNTIGSMNNFMGDLAGQSNKTGESNVFIGDDAGQRSDSSSKNVFIGKEAGSHLQGKGGLNTFIGAYSGYEVTSSVNNIFLGPYAGQKASNSFNNIFLGDSSGYNATNTSYNIFLGNKAGYSNTGTYNNFIGYQAGCNNTTGHENNFIGYQAGDSNTTGYKNNFIGYQAGYYNADGNKNNFIGYQAGYKNTGSTNDFIGYQAGYNNEGAWNTFIGNQTGFYNTGWLNVFVGYHSGYKNTSGSNNTFVGLSAGVSNKSGNNNAFFGNLAGDNIDSGSYNTFIGTYAGYYFDKKSNNNIALGYYAGPTSLGTYSNRLYINNYKSDFPLIYGEFDNQIVAINGKLGVGIQSPTHKLHVVDLTVNKDAAAVYGEHAVTDGYGIGVEGVGKYRGVEGKSFSNSDNYNSYGGYFIAKNEGSKNAYGIYAEVTSDGSGTHYAAYFQGDVHVNGTLSKSAGSFKIDDPRDPANKYLIHSFVESPDMKNIYDGVIVLDENGEAVVSLPDYFEVINKDFRYLLTPIGQSAPNLYIKQEVSHGKFIIAGGNPGQKISWQVTGIRKDPYAKAHPIIPVVEKPASEKGKYLNPELYGKPKSMGIGYNVKFKK